MLVFGKQSVHNNIQGVAKTIPDLVIWYDCNLSLSEGTSVGIIYIDRNQYRPYCYFVSKYLFHSDRCLVIGILYEKCSRGNSTYLISLHRN